MSTYTMEHFEPQSENVDETLSTDVHVHVSPNLPSAENMEIMENTEDVENTDSYLDHDDGVFNVEVIDEVTTEHETTTADTLDVVVEKSEKTNDDTKKDDENTVVDVDHNSEPQPEPQPESESQPESDPLSESESEKSNGEELESDNSEISNIVLLDNDNNNNTDSLVKRFYDLADANRTALKPALVSYNDQIEVSEIYTWKEYADLVTRFKNYLLLNNLSNTAIHAFNSPEWFVAAIGSIAAGSHVAGIYNTNTDKQCLHVIKTGNCDVLVIDTVDTLLNHYSQVFDALIELNTRILIIDSNFDMAKYSEKLNSNDDMRKKLETMFDKQIKIFDSEINSTTNSRTAYRVNVDLDSTVTLIFTSGTTSDPKAVKITHRNVMASIDAVLERIPLGLDDSQSEVVLSYLPLSHVAGQCLDIYAQIYHKGEVHFARPDALKGSLKKSLLKARPTVFLGVPRVWEKIREGLLAAGEKKYQGYSGSVLRGIANAAKGVNYSYQKTVEDSKTQWGSYFASYLNYPAYYVSSTLTDQVKSGLGLDRCKYFVSGAAPISRDILEYFMSLNMPIMEIYGMSETAGVITISDPFSAIDRYCGCPVQGVDVRIERSTSEILVKGDNVFSGYHNYSGDLSDMFDQDGYFHTGDCGVMEGGKLKITGRLKELIITAGGENVPPVLIETHIKREAHTDSQMMVIGDQQKYLTILVFNPSNEPQLSDLDVSAAVTMYNKYHKISQAQTIQKFRIIREELTVESGLLTPTMKMKRKLIADHYKDIIDELYKD